MQNNLGLVRLLLSDIVAAGGGGVADFVGYLRRCLRDLLPLALFLAGLISGPAYAQDLSPAERAELQAKKDQLFQRSLREVVKLTKRVEPRGL